MRRPRRLAISMLALAAIAAGVAAQRVAWAATSFSVINNGMSTWLINGQNNPTLMLTKGQTYNFVIDQTAFGHPFWIATQRGAGDTESNQFSVGVTNNGAAAGTTLTFTVPASAPATLFYQCSVHDTMGGQLNIVAPAVSSVPATGRVGLAALAVLLLLVAALIGRRRQKMMAAMRDSDQ